MGTAYHFLTSILTLFDDVNSVNDEPASEICDPFFRGT
jgi:hypothetical protein